MIKVPKQQVKKKCDPVSLYHYYTSLWDKYKSNVPGENDWAELRWSIRQRMAGSTASTVNKVICFQELTSVKVHLTVYLQTVIVTTKMKEPLLYSLLKNYMNIFKI